jgi:dCTP deaminase
MTQPMQLNLDMSWGDGKPGLLRDVDIHALALGAAMIAPYVDHQVSEEGGRRVVSYGLSSAGYDMRLAPELLLGVAQPAPFNLKAIHPRDFWECEIHQDEWGQYALIPPHGFVLGRSVEHWHIPDDVVVVVQGKSTLARAGWHVLVTPMEPGWQGYLTIEIANLLPRQNRLYVGEGIAQAIFYRLSARPEVTYNDRGGKYMNQTGVTLPRM